MLKYVVCGLHNLPNKRKQNANRISLDPSSNLLQRCSFLVIPS